MRNKSVDAFRLIASFAIILLHVDFFYFSEPVKNNVRLLGRFAVPFFFLVAGYYFYQNYQKKGDTYFLQNLQRLISIFIVASLVYVPFGLEEIYLNYNLFARGGSFHLWFMSSLIFGTIMCWFNFSYLKNDILFSILSGVILLLCVVSDSYGFSISFPRDYGFIMYLISIPFFYMGTIIAKKNIRLSTSYSILIVLAGVGIQIGEAHFLESSRGINPFNHQFLIGTIPYTLGMFFLSFSGLNFDMLGNLGKKYSLGIYLYHILVCRFFAERVNQSDNMSVLFLNPLTIFFVTLIILMLIETYMPKFFLLLNGDFNLKRDRSPASQTEQFE